jgi:hypothetical protein
MANNLNVFSQKPPNMYRSLVTITLGTTPIELPEPLAGHVTTLLATRRARVAKRITDPGPWLFPSQHRPAGPARQPPRRRLAKRRPAAPEFANTPRNPEPAWLRRLPVRRRPEPKR